MFTNTSICLYYANGGVFLDLGLFFVSGGTRAPISPSPSAWSSSYIAITCLSDLCCYSCLLFSLLKCLKSANFLVNMLMSFVHENLPKGGVGVNDNPLLSRKTSSLLIVKDKRIYCSQRR